ncbi:MAG: WbqC family protein [Salibacteraceae bacterium]|nr:WbqC family protein [Salibacteraceae bacterium]
MNNSVILPSALFPPISYFALILKENKLGRIPTIEHHDFFVKQTVRNRYRIYTAQGEHLLSVPLVSKSSKTLLKSIEINYEMPWQKEHYRTLLAAYSSTPFFEHYIEALMPLFKSKFSSLLEMNTWAFEKMIELLDLSITAEYSDKYIESDLEKDFRTTRNELYAEFNTTYYQLNFDQGMPFIGNLSILDVLFNKGPEARLLIKAY